MTEPAVPSRNFTWAEIAFAVAGVALLIGAALALAYASWPNGSGGSSETFRFITLLVIFMAALTAAAGVFVWLRIDNPGEAFALPPGSIRVLLAIGIMVLFVVFGLPAVSPLPASEAHLTDRPIASFAVPAAQLGAAVELHRSEGLTVVVNDYGGATTPARVSVYAKVKSRPAAELDLAKQLLTALITALTTVIGFYFGSRSASDAAGAIGKAADRLAGDPSRGPVGGKPGNGKPIDSKPSDRDINKPKEPVAT